MSTSTTATTMRSQPSSGGRNAVAIARPYSMTKYPMSWTRTPVSPTIAVPDARRRRHHNTRTPVTNMASVDSMNGAPRIAPTPTASVSSPPPPKPIAMIGIIVSGSAVPTAASTEPTAPCARLSLWPNHSMPFVNSSAPTRMTTNAAARTRRSTSGRQLDRRRDRHEHDEQHQGRDEGEAPVARREEVEARHDDAPDRQPDHEHDAGPQEPLGAEREDRRRHGGEVERR